MPAISVVIPVYNVENYIAKCLDSLLEQDFADVEILCVNDGSLDKSRELILEYQNSHKNIKLIDRENGGLSAARNTGIKHAEGKYLVFLDSDDYLAPNIFTGIYNQMEAENLDVILGNVCWVYGDGKEYRENQVFDLINVVQSGEDCFNKLIENDYYVPMAYNTICRRNFIVENHLYFKEGYVYEDEMWTPELLLKAKRVNGFREYHYNYFQRANTITNSELSDYKLSCMLYAAKYLIQYSKQFTNNTKANLWVRAFDIWNMYYELSKINNIKVTHAQFTSLNLLKEHLPNLQFEKCLQNCVHSKYVRRVNRLIYKLSIF